MATKAELEAELAALKAELARNADRTQPDDPDKDADASADQAEDDKNADPADVATQLVEDVLEQLNELPNNKAFLLLAGVFVAGYLLGRSK